MFVNPPFTTSPGDPLSEQYNHRNHTSAEENQNKRSKCFSDDFRNKRVTHGQEVYHRR